MTEFERYIAHCNQEAQPRLKKIRQLVHTLVPDVEEVVSYRMPSFKYKGRILLYMGAFTHHIGLYPPPPQAVKEQAAKYAGPKGNLRFPYDEPMPYDLIEAIIRERIGRREE